VVNYTYPTLSEKETVQNSDDPTDPTWCRWSFSENWVLLLTHTFCLIPVLNLLALNTKCRWENKLWGLFK